MQNHISRLAKFIAARRRASAAAGVVFLAVLAVAALSDDVIDGHTQAFDESVLLLFRHDGHPIGPLWLPQLVGDLTALGSYGPLALFTALAAGFALVVRRYEAFGFMVFSALGALSLNVTLKLLVARARPEVVGHLTDVSSYSYPSGHALMSSALYLSFAAIAAGMTRDRAARAYLIAAGVLMTLLVGVSRLYLGVHYPTDVAAGWLIGGSWALFCWLCVRAAKRWHAMRHERSGL